jgi:hypothetical protein
MRTLVLGVIAIGAILQGSPSVFAQPAGGGQPNPALTPEPQKQRELANTLYNIAKLPGKISTRMAAIDALGALGAKSTTASQNLIKLLGYKKQKDDTLEFDPTSDKQLPTAEQIIFIHHVVLALGNIGPAADGAIADAIPALLAWKDKDSVLDVAIDTAIAALLKDLSALGPKAPQTPMGQPMGTGQDKAAALKQAAADIKPKDPKNPTADELKTLSAIIGDPEIEAGIRLAAAKHIPDTIKLDATMKPIVTAALQKAAMDPDATLKEYAAALNKKLGM